MTNPAEEYTAGIYSRRCFTFNKTGRLAHNFPDKKRKSYYEPEKQVEPRKLSSHMPQVYPV